MASILIVGTNMMSIYNHRLELIKRLIELHHEVSVATPFSGEEQNLIKMGVKCINIKLETRGRNPLHDLVLLKNLIKIFKKEKPDVVLTFYTKTNIYGGIAARVCGIPYIENITGVGSAVSNGGIMANMMMTLYSHAVRKAHMVFFQNTDNQTLFHDKRISIRKERLLPGSGVSLERFSLMSYPTTDEYHFLFISRVLKEKGIYEFVEAAKIIKKEYPSATFHVIGPYDKEYKEYLIKAAEEGTIKVHGKVFNVAEFIRNSHCTVFPSYYAEGMANVLLESAASGRPIITTNLPGCGETVDDGVTGYVVQPCNAEDVADKIRRFILLTHEEKKAMGEAGRKKMERHFDRRIVVDAYVDEINEILQTRLSTKSSNSQINGTASSQESRGNWSSTL